MLGDYQPLRSVLLEKCYRLYVVIFVNSAYLISPPSVHLENWDQFLHFYELHYKT